MSEMLQVEDLAKEISQRKQAIEKLRQRAITLKAERAQIEPRKTKLREQYKAGVRKLELENQNLKKEKHEVNLQIRDQNSEITRLTNQLIERCE